MGTIPSQPFTEGEGEREEEEGGRGGSGSRTEGGSGLGLAIVKHIIEAHNEKIYVVSEFGEGSEFSFTLEKASKPLTV